MPHRIAFGSCSHPSLPQPLWKIIKSRHPAAFVWGGDAIYADKYAGLNWTAVGFHRINDDQTQNSSSSSSSWRLTFPPPSVHVDATPKIIHDWYEKQWGIEDYRSFVEGWYDDEHNINNTQSYNIKPLLFGTVDDHDYGQNNGDYTYQYKKESNIEFVNFLYLGVANDHQTNDICTQDVHSSDNAFEESTSQQQESNKSYDRHKDNDPMYQRALKGNGVYGVQLFDFSKTKNEHNISNSYNNNNILWGNGYWVPEIFAQIDPDVMITSNVSSSETPSYSTTHSVAIFALDVRTNKTPWPKGKQIHTDNTIQDRNSSSFIPILDFLGEEQWLWFKQALNNSHATVNIIVSGLQVHPERFPNDGNVVEEWSKFPEARQLLYNTILNSGVKSPMIVSGDVHMAQFMRKDCVKASGMIQSRSSTSNHQVRPLVEITTSGMTHSWGTSFSSQPKHHRLPLKPYSYFVSNVFMTICHWVCGWNDILIQSTNEESRGGKLGLQYYLGLNFAEFEFDFKDEGKGGGTVTTRIFGKEEDAVPKLEMSWTFDELSGNTHAKGNTARYLQDFLPMNIDIENTGDEWICIPHRGIPSVIQEYVANAIMFISFCILFFFPHVIMLYLLRKIWLRWKRIGIK